MAGGKREGAGRPRGRSPLTKARETLLEHSDEIIELLMEKVREGDIAALKVAVERIIPVLKEVSTPIKGENPLEQYQDILELVAGGEVTPAKGGEMMVLVHQAKRRISDETMFPGL